MNKVVRLLGCILLIVAVIAAALFLWAGYLVFFESGWLASIGVKVFDLTVLMFINEKSVRLSETGILVVGVLAVSVFTFGASSFLKSLIQGGLALVRHEGNDSAA
ncbi:MAG: hypothetical protein V7739_21055 [Motiliproteus sp.]